MKIYHDLYNGMIFDFRGVNEDILFTYKLMFILLIKFVSDLMPMRSNPY